MKLWQTVLLNHLEVEAKKWNQYFPIINKSINYFIPSLDIFDILSSSRSILMYSNLKLTNHFNFPG